MIYAIIITHSFFSSLFHSIVPHNTLSSWRQLRPQSESTSCSFAFQRPVPDSAYWWAYVCVCSQEKARWERGGGWDGGRCDRPQVDCGENRGVETIDQGHTREAQVHILTLTWTITCCLLTVTLLLCPFRKLKRETELIQAGHLDSKLEELWEEILR